MIKKSPFHILVCFVFSLKDYFSYFFNGNKFLRLDMTEISAVKVNFCLRSRT